jgi:hypothetical protein
MMSTFCVSSRDEIVRLVARHRRSLVVPLLVGVAGAADHDVGVVVDRVDRVADGDDVVQGKDVEDVGAVALGAVGDEHLLGLEGNAERFVGLLDDGVDQPVIPLLRAVAGELVGGKVVHRPVERLITAGAAVATSPIPRRMTFAAGWRRQIHERGGDLGEEVAGLSLVLLLMWPAQAPSIWIGL